MVFTPNFEDYTGRRVLETHRGLRSKVATNCLVSNVFLLSNLLKMDDMTCSELNQFIGDGKYKAILTRKKLGERALMMEYVMYALMDTLYCLDFDNTMAVVKLMCADYSNIAKIKEELESANKAQPKLKSKMEKLVDARKTLLRTTKEMRLDFDTPEWELQKEVVDLKELDEERKHIKEWEPAVKLLCDKIPTLLPMGGEHNLVCSAFVLVWEEYYKKFEYEVASEDNA